MTSAVRPLDLENAATIASAFDLGSVNAFDGPTARGELGQVFRLSTASGRWAVKQPFHRQADDEAQEDAALIVAARTAGVPTPDVRLTNTGAVLRDLPGTQARVYEWVDHTEPDPGLDPEAIGVAVAALHRTPHRTSRGQHPWYRTPVGAARWDELTAALSAAGAPFASDLAGMREEFVALERWLADPVDLRVCHRDLFPENLRGTGDGGVCVIDWDGHGLAGAGQELAHVVWAFSCGSAERAVTITRAYRDGGGPGRIGGPGDFTMIIASLGHINERACTRWLESPAGDPERDRMASLFGESVADPLTRAVVADLLDAVA
jgi:Ser/Thr protein kinase RdoA (MazF antagonist)